MEDRQYQVDLQSIIIGTAQWEQLKPEKEGIKGGVSAESERNSQNPALEWNMASRSEVKIGQKYELTVVLKFLCWPESKLRDDAHFALYLPYVLSRRWFAKLLAI